MQYQVTNMYQTGENRVCPKAARACPNPRMLHILRTGFFLDLKFSAIVISVSPETEIEFIGLTYVILLTSGIIRCLLNPSPPLVHPSFYFPVVVNTCCSHPPAPWFTHPIPKPKKDKYSMVTLVTRGIIFPLFGRVKTHLYRKIGTGCDLH